MKIFQTCVACSEDDESMSVKDHRRSRISKSDLFGTIEKAVAHALLVVEEELKMLMEDDSSMNQLVWQDEHDDEVAKADVPGILANLKDGSSFLCATHPENSDLWWWIAIHEHEIG